jgi:hypothetical protein
MAGFTEWASKSGADYKRVLEELADFNIPHYKIFADC